MHVLITGGAGFIGSHLVEYYLSQQHTVHVIDNFSTGIIENLQEFQQNQNFSITHADILTYSELDFLVAQADCIYHMAAVVGVLRVIANEQDLLETNILGTERLLRAAKISTKKPRILLASTSEVYGESEHGVSPETDSLIIGKGKKNCAAYVVSKIALEYFSLAYYKNYGLPITVLRIFNTIGPRQLGHYGMVVPRFIQYALNQQPILVHGTGVQTRSFCDVRDLVIIMDRLVTSSAAIGQILNIGQDQEVSINALALLVKELTNSASEIQHITYEQVYGEGFTDCMARRPDLTKLQNIINYAYQWDLKTTLMNLI